MVGVAGRSKGCGTCRKRKIRCGLQRPACAQCIKSNRLCTGYQREPVFLVNQDLRTHPYRSKPSDPGNNIQVASWEISSAVRKPRHKAAQKEYKLPEAEVQLLHSFSPVSAYRQRVFDVFIRAWVPPDQLDPDHWLYSVAILSKHSPTLRIAAQAVAIGHIGIHHNDDFLRVQSLKYYTQGLRELHGALSDPNEIHSDETLAACLMLSIYELIACPAKGRYGYVSHQDGCARLVHERGPYAHQDGLGHSLFTAVRSLYSMRSVELHATTYLTEPDWMTIPWEKQPKTESDRLWDCIAYAPSIFKRADRFQRIGGVESLCLALELLDECWTMDKHLEGFYQHMENNVPGPLFWPELSKSTSPIDDEDGGKVFPVAYHFCNLRIASVMMMYWATLCMMWHGMTLLHGVFRDTPVDRKEVAAFQDCPPVLRSGIPECDLDCPCKTDPSVSCLSHFDMTKLKPMGHREDYVTPGKNVLQSIEWAHQPEHLVYGIASTMAPLGLVMGTFSIHPEYRREVEWAREIFRRVADDRFPYLKYVISLTGPEVVVNPDTQA